MEVKLELQLLAYAQPQLLGIRSTSANYTTAHTPHYWSRPGVKPASLWILVGFVSTVPQREVPGCLHLNGNSCVQVGGCLMLLLLVIWKFKFGRMLRMVLNSHRVDYFGYLWENNRKWTKGRKSHFFLLFFASDRASEAGQFQKILRQNNPAFMQFWQW